MHHSWIATPCKGKACDDGSDYFINGNGIKTDLRYLYFFQISLSLKTEFLTSEFLTSQSLASEFLTS
jgi:hypothetical protein